MFFKEAEKHLYELSYISATCVLPNIMWKHTIMYIP